MRIEAALQLFNFHLTDFKDLGPAYTHLYTVSMMNTSMKAYTFSNYSCFNYKQKGNYVSYFP